MAIITEYTISTSKLFNLPVIHQNNRVGFKNFAFDALTGFNPVSQVKSFTRLRSKAIYPNSFIKKISNFQTLKILWGGNE